MIRNNECECLKIYYYKTISNQDPQSYDMDKAQRLEKSEIRKYRTL